MSVNNFIPELWSAQVLQSFLKTTVFASPLVCNRDYEGEIAQAGDTVHITSVGRPTISAYSRGGTLTYESLVDAGRDLNIDQCYEFSFSLDDVDKRQAVNGGRLMSEYAREGGAGLAETADAYVQSLLEADCAAAQKIGATSITTSALAVARLVAHKQMLDIAKVPAEGRYTICPSWFASLLLLDSTAIMADGIRGGVEISSGVVGRKMGMDIVVGQYALSTGDDWYVYSGHPSAVTFADQINNVEALRLQTTFGDGLRGLHLYGAKVTRPTAICMTLCSVT
jgi:hypothetical protein